MKDEDRLHARGFREVAPGQWKRRDGWEHEVFTLGGALAECRIVDEAEARTKGSVTYVPTDEQGLASPLLRACAAHGGMTEHEVIEHLFRENQRLLTDLKSLAETAVDPVRIASDLAPGTVFRFSDTSAKKGG